MGQQQLLLVILVTIIVSTATVVAIDTFGSAVNSTTEDAVRQDLVQIAAAAQSYYIKPAHLGGGGRSFVGVTFQGLAFPASGLNADIDIATNVNGIYQINSTTQESFTVTAIASSGKDYTAPVIENGVITTAGSGTVIFTAAITSNDLSIVKETVTP